jgi:GTP-binding protein
MPFEGQGLPEIAIVGKSNVGKSSLINCVLNNKKIAKVSGAPGKTRLINLFRVNDRFFIVDLPGYGFARAPQYEKDKWAQMIEGYLSASENLRLVLQLVDVRHTPTAEDQMMIRYLRHYDRPFVVIATKCDKVSGAERGRRIQEIVRTLAVQPWQVIPFSSESALGREQTLALMPDEDETNRE